MQLQNAAYVTDCVSLAATRDRIQGMHMHERHNAAASAAMRLAAALGLEGESSSEEDSP